MKKAICLFIFFMLIVVNGYANNYGVFKDDSDRVVKKICYLNESNPASPGLTFEKCNKEQFISYDTDDYYKIKKYNDTRFKTSLLADQELNSFGFTVFYGAISDCLQSKNWVALETVFGVMVSQGAATQGDIKKFKAKLKSEEGVDLDAKI